VAALNSQYLRIFHDHFYDWCVPKKTSGGLLPLVAVDRRAEKPLHRQIYEAFRAGIVGRQLLPGQRAPSSRALAIELGVSRIPVLEAYAQLLAEGYFESRHGAGTFVSSLLPKEAGAGTEKGQALHGSRDISRRAAVLPGWDAAPWVTMGGAFCVGVLNYEHFPFALWSNLVSRHARKVRASSLNYGDPLGHAGLRESIAAYLRTARGVRCEASQVIVVSGSQQALDLCARVLMDPGDAVWMEEPGYQLMRNTFKLAGCEIVPVPVDAEGLDLAAGLRLRGDAKAVYVTPSHQYPLGMTMSAARRLQLLRWAHDAGSWILEDDYDSEYRFESMPIASLQGLDNASRVIYIGTFSKTFFPSLRLGYMVIPADLVDRFAAARRVTDICAPDLYQSALTEFIDGGHFARHIRKTRALYNERRVALVKAIRQYLGDKFEVLGAEAGMHLVVTLPEGLRDRDISLRAAEEKLWLWPLSTAYIEKPTKQGFILGFGSVQAADIDRGVQRLRGFLEM
jgi:GntR family transcriptional regulator / MocR family aminotransferase